MAIINRDEMYYKTVYLVWYKLVAVFEGQVVQRQKVHGQRVSTDEVAVELTNLTVFDNTDSHPTYNHPLEIGSFVMS